MGALLSMIRGDRSLPETYWLWFAIASGLVYWLGWALLTYVGGLPNLSVSTAWTAIIVVAPAQCFAIFVMGYAGIQSAMRRQPRDVWAIIAIIVAFAGMLRTGFEYYARYVPIVAPQSVEEQQAEFLRKFSAELPVSTELTTLVRYTFDGTTLVYHFAPIVDENIGLNVEKFKRTGGFEVACENLKGMYVVNVIESLRLVLQVNGAFHAIEISDAVCP
jgi:hypothetical protein